MKHLSFLDIKLQIILTRNRTVIFLHDYYNFTSSHISEDKHLCSICNILLAEWILKAQILPVGLRSSETYKTIKAENE